MFPLSGVLVASAIPTIPPHKPSRLFGYIITMYIIVRKECRCDNGYGRYGREISDGKCNVRCDGHSGQICGGDWSNSVYQIRGKIYMYM